MSHTQDNPEIARLQVQVEGIGNSVSALRDAQAAQFSAITARLDSFTDIVREIARMQAHQQEHSNGLARAFEDIKTHKAECAEVDADHHAWRKDHETEHKHLSQKLNRAVGWASGVGVILSMMLGVVIWAGNRIITQLDETSDKANDNAIKLLEYKLEQANKRGAP